MEVHFKTEKINKLRINILNCIINKNIITILI